MLKRMTKNRTLLLKVLSSELPDCGGQPPYSASSVHYTLNNAFEYTWDGYGNMATLPSIRQIHRTLRDLWHEGLIVASREKIDGIRDGLPYWEMSFQLSTDVESNWIKTECDRVFNAVKKAKHGFNLFGSVLDRGLPSHEVEVLRLRAKALIQKTHPDKAAGFEDQFKQMKQCIDAIRDGIPEPMPTHAAQDQAQSKRIR
ncbi:hypothetical protein [Crenothrix sp.]|uniref:hypothetical protein n=1 Tax=Crenothrix sp. TaxID=3100433 RepID=UPI00374CF5F1